MAGDSAQIAQLRQRVQQLAQKLHIAKTELDSDPYYRGLDDPQVRARVRQNWRAFPDRNWHKRAVDTKVQAYRRARQEYMAAKTELDELEEQQRTGRAITGARERMTARFAPEISKAAQASLTQGTEFDLAKHPKMVKAISESITEAVRTMRSERSVPSVLATVETVAAAEEMGFGDLRPAERKQALDDASRMAVELRDSLRKQTNPAIPAQQKRLLRLEALVQFLGP